MSIHPRISAIPRLVLSDDPRTKALRFAVLMACAAVAVLSTGIGARALDPAGRKEILGSLRAAAAAAGPLGPSLFVSAYALLATCVPAMPFEAAGIFVFGAPAGILWNVLGGLGAATLSFLLGRRYLKDAARDLLLRHRVFRAVDEAADRRGALIVVVLRLCCSPFLVTNYAASVTRMPFRDYLLGSAIGGAAVSSILSVLFSEVRTTVDAGGSLASLLSNASFVAPIAFFAACAWLLRRAGRKPAGGEPR